MNSTIGILLAAGSSQRLGENKLFLHIGGMSVLERSLTALCSAGCFDRVVIACRDCDIPQVKQTAENTLHIPFEIVEGGSERQYSVGNALTAAKGAEVVAIHDAARCFVNPAVIRACVEKAYETGAAAAGVRTKDTIKVADGDNITGTLDRGCLINIQTPQAFRYSIICEAHEAAHKEGYLATDDCALVERMSMPVKLVESDYDNIKITTQEDIMLGKAIAGEKIRTGIGYDAHQLHTGLPLILGGVKVPHIKGLKGHSDADVLLHAVIDALLGAAAAGDIGTHFPGTDEYQGISSIELLRRTYRIVTEKGFAVVNVDATVVIQYPKLAPFIGEMRKNIADVLGIGIDAVSVKAKTTEWMGFEGEEKGASATAVATICGGY